MSASISTPAPWRVPAPVWDVLAALFVAGSAFIRFPGTIEDRSPLGWIAVLAPAFVVLFRRRFPWLVLIACLVLFGVSAFTTSLTPASFFATAIAVYAVAIRTDRRTALITAVGVIVLLVVEVGIAHGTYLVPWTVQIVVTIGFAAALGDANRTRRAYIDEIMARAVNAEATREAEASRRVAEDRLAIARDLHDTVAHQISVISLNAGVASSAIADRPDTAREALATIRSASRQVLAEIGGLLATLRDDRPGIRPAPGLGALNALTASFADSGLQVTVRREYTAGDLPAAVDVVAYRVIQEGLTNAHKHGTGGRAHVWISDVDAGIRITITNTTDDEPVGAVQGHGLIGIRERVESVKGTAQMGQVGNSYRLEVDLPTEVPA